MANRSANSKVQKREKMYHMFEVKQHATTILLYLLLIWVTQLSCNYDKYSDRINSNKGTFWDLVKINQRIFADSSAAWYFGVNGTFKKFISRKNDKGNIDRTLITDKETWTLHADTLMISNTQNFLFHQSGKNIRLISLNGTNDTIELRESAIQ